MKKLLVSELERRKKNLKEELIILKEGISKTSTILNENKKELVKQDDGILKIEMKKKMLDKESEKHIKDALLKKQKLKEQSKDLVSLISKVGDILKMKSEIDDDVAIIDNTIGKENQKEFMVEQALNKVGKEILKRLEKQQTGDFTPRFLKPREGFEKFEFSDPERLWDLWKEKYSPIKPILLNSKWDGFSFNLMKNEDEVKIITEDRRRDRAEILTQVTDEVKKLPIKSCNIQAEGVWFRNGKALEREESIRVIVGKDPMPKEDVRMFCHDIAYADKDLTDLPYLDRLKILDKLINGKGKYLKPTPRKIVKDKKTYLTWTKKFSKVNGSEGIMAKKVDFKFVTKDSETARTPEMAKMKKSFDIEVEVKKSNPKISIDTRKPISGQWIYDVIVRGKENEEIPIGRTFSTSIKVKVGDILTVRTARLRGYYDPERKKVIRFSMMWPKVLGMRTDLTKPTSFKELMKIAWFPKKISLSKILIKFKGDKLTIEHNDKLNFKKKANRFKLEKENESIHKLENGYKVQIGNRSLILSSDITELDPKDLASADLLIANPINIESQIKLCEEVGISEIIFTNKPTDIKLPKKSELVEYVFNKGDSTYGAFELEQELSKKLRFVFQDHWRLKSVHGDIRFERNDHLDGWTLDYGKKRMSKKPVLTIKDAKKMANTKNNWKINFETGETIKLPSGQPMKILSQQKGKQPGGWRTLEGIIPKGLPGATATSSAVMLIRDKGFYEQGVEKPYYFEVFLHGKYLKGIYVFRKLPTSGLKPRGEPLKIPMVWFFWKKLEQVPYMLSKRALETKTIPPVGVSWLPKKTENLIPDEMRYWVPNIAMDERLNRLEEAIDFWNGREIEMSHELNKVKFLKGIEA